MFRKVVILVALLFFWMLPVSLWSLSLSPLPEEEIRKRVQRHLRGMSEEEILVFLQDLSENAEKYAVFSIRTDPPITIGSWLCNCRTSGCECNLGSNKVYIIFHAADFFFWPKYALRDAFGNLYCAEKCVLNIGTPVQVESSLIKVLFSKEGSKIFSRIKKSSQGQENLSDHLVSILKEKNIQNMQSEAQKLGIDLTTLFVFRLAERLYGEITVATVFQTVEMLLNLVTRGMR